MARFGASSCNLVGIRGLLGALLALCAACVGATDPSIPNGPPLVVGSVFSRDTSAAAPQVLVVVATAADARPECGVQFALSNRTKVIRVDGSKGTVREITVGTRVRVWADDGPFSTPLCRPSGGASVVAIEP